MIIALLFLVACAFFTASEMAFISCDWITLRNWTKEKKRGAESAIRSLRNLDKLLTTTLVGTNLVIVGMSVLMSKLWHHKFEEPFIIVFTGLLIFMAGEILPKSIASRIKERLAIVLVKPYTVIYIIFYPLIFITYYTSLGLLKIFGVSTFSIFHKFTREDLRIASKRTLPVREYNIISRLLDFRGKRAKDIMIPRDKILAAPLNISFSLLKQVVAKSGYSRVPIYGSDIDEIKGVVTAKTLLTKTNIKDAIKNCKLIDEATPVELLLEEIKREGTLFAIVKNKYGRTLGLITIEDVLEELFGEIKDEYD
jgi:CBS domain containing-hemolysin-like protein